LTIYYWLDVRHTAGTQYEVSEGSLKKYILVTKVCQSYQRSYDIPGPVRLDLAVNFTTCLKCIFRGGHAVARRPVKVVHVAAVSCRWPVTWAIIARRAFRTSTAAPVRLRKSTSARNFELPTLQTPNQSSDNVVRGGRV